MHKVIRHQRKTKLRAGSTPHRMRLLFLFASLTLALATSGGQHNNALALSSETADNDFSVSVDLSLNITLSSANVSLPIVPKDGGQFGRTFINVWADTNNVTGYNLTMQASGDTLTSTKQTDPTYTIDPLAQQVSCSDESDDTCTSFPVNQWGYRIGSTGAYLPTTNIVDTPIQLSHAHTYTTDTDPVATLYFGAKVDETKPAGIYDGVKFTFTATSNVTSASALIKPDTANGITKITLNGEECTDDAGCLVEGLIPWESYDLVATIADGYTFSGWNIDGKGEVTDPTSTNTQFTVGNGDVTITTSAEFAFGNCDNAATCMQTMTIDQCTADGVTVYDSRDGSDYIVKKLADGKCWMVQNLRLGSTAGTTRLYPSDTNLASTAAYWDLPAISSTAPANDYNNATLYVPTGTPKIYNGTSWVAITGPNDRGVLYNYAAASAGTITGESNTTPAEYDICPKKWHLPTANSDTSDTGALVKAYGASNGTSNISTGTVYTKFNTAFRSVRSGLFSGGVQSNVGGDGCWWSRTPNTSDAANRYGLTVSDSRVNPAGNYGRRSGLSIRCVFGG